MKWTLIGLLACSLLVGCSGSADVSLDTSGESAVVEAAPAAAADTGKASQVMMPQDVLDLPVLELTPQNTTIQFVGVHTGDKPDPRTGQFQDFSGEIRFNPDTKQVRWIDVTIQTKSLTTEIPRLTTHLQSADFFDVRQYPTAAFKSNNIKPLENEQNQYKVIGQLTLHGVTKEIEFVSSINLSEDLTMLAQFMIERREFNMTYGPDRVENDVAMTIAVGGSIEDLQPDQVSSASQ